MGNIVFSQAAKFLKKRRNTRRWIAVVLCLALIVTSGTFGALTRHGSALTGAEQVLACTYENHVHGEECYNEAGELVCGYADYCVHVHNESCYDSEGNLVCPLPEIEAHVHDESCYVDEEQLICGMEENEIHQHTDDCYDIELGDLVCELEEHVHDDSCYELITEEDEIPENGTDADGENTQGETPDRSETPVQSETPATSEEPAENDNTAQSEAPAVSQTPAQSEAPAASQEPEQSEAPAVSAEPGQSGEPAASQTPEQSAEPSASGEAAQSEEPAEAVQSAEPAGDTETARTGEAAESTETQQGETPAESTESSDGGEINECAESRRLICGMEEHTHGNECYNQNKVLKCGKKEESVPHVHSDECYELKHVAKCGKLELHTHTEECYTDGVLTCGKLELKEHVHTEECFREAPVMELTATAGDATITVSANEEGIIPAGAELSVTPVVKTEADTLDNLESEEERAEAEALNAVYDEIQQGLEASVEENDTKEIKHFLAYDISFHTQNENGETEEVKLNGDVNVTLEFPQGALPEEIIFDENTQIESVDVLDVKETEEGRVAETQDAVVNTTQDTDVEKIETTLSDSSTLAIAWIGEINPDGQYVYEDDDVIITVSALDEGAIPENAKLKVVPIIASEETGEQYQQVAEKLMEKAENEEYAIAGFLAYDISFVDGEGNKIEPSGEVKVTMNYKEAKIPAEVDAATYAFASEEASEETGEDAASNAELNVKVMHLEEDIEGSINVVDMAEQDKVTALETTEEQKIQNAEFVTGGFSVFTITWTIGSNGAEYVYEDDQVVITVTAVEPDAIPEGTKLQVIPVVPEKEETAEQYQQVAEKLVEQAENEVYDIAGFLAYDISFVDEAGNEVEPNGEVKVTMNYKEAKIPAEVDASTYAYANEDASEGAGDSTEEEKVLNVTVMHLQEDEQGGINVVDMAKDDKVGTLNVTEEKEVQKAEFVTDSFSIFTITWIWDGKNPYVYEDENVIITITPVDENSIPEGTKLRIIPIKADDPETAEEYKEVGKNLLEKATDEEYDIAGFAAYDISLIGNGGEEIEPNGKVKITMEYKKAVTPTEMSFETSALEADGEATGEMDAQFEEMKEAEGESVQPDTSQVVEDGSVQPETIEGAEGSIQSQATDGESEEDEEPEVSDNSANTSTISVSFGDEETQEDPQMNVTVMHLEEDEAGEVAQVVDLAEDGNVQMDVNENQEVKKVEFETETFSKFVITWTSGSNIRTLEIMFVDQTGAEIGIPDALKLSFEATLKDRMGDGEFDVTEIKADGLYKEIFQFVGVGRNCTFSKATVGNSGNPTETTGFRLHNGVVQYRNGQSEWKNVSSQTVKFVYNAGGLLTEETINNTDYGITIKMTRMTHQKQQEIFGDTGNWWINTGNDQGGVTQGAVQNKLGTDGYPVARNRTSKTDWGNNYQSLKQLFDNGTQKEVNHLFRQDIYDADGYFEYSSFENYAYLGDSNNFTVYKAIGTPRNLGSSDPAGNHIYYWMKRGNFFPYNNIVAGSYSENRNRYDEYGSELISGEDDRYDELLYKPQGSIVYNFGMEMSATFTQPKGGEIGGKPMRYEFNGDDDLWIFIDGVLILDMGGNHDARSGYIDFKTGDVGVQTGDIYRNKGNTNEGNINKDGYHTTIKDMFRGAGVFPDGSTWDDAKVGNYFNGNTFKDYISHELKMFYMERGSDENKEDNANASNLHIKTNLRAIPVGNVEVEKQITNTDKEKYADADFSFQMYLQKKTGQVDANKNDTFYENEYSLLNSTLPEFAGGTIKAKKILADGTDGGVLSIASDGTFKLKTGEKAQFSGIQSNRKYYVVETGVSSESYTVIANDVIAIERKDGVDSTTASYEIEAIDVATRPYVLYENRLTAGSELHITKAMQKGQSSSDTFAFRVKLGGIPYVDDYYVKDSDGKYVYSDGTHTNEAKVYGEKASNGIISGIKAGYTVIITGGVAPEGTDTGIVDSDGNKRYASLAPNTTFSVEEVVEKDGAYVNVSSLPSGSDYQYKLIEITDTGTDTFTLKESGDGEKTVRDSEGNITTVVGVIKSMTDAKVTVTNSRKITYSWEVVKRSSSSTESEPLYLADAEFELVKLGSNDQPLTGEKAVTYYGKSVATTGVVTWYVKPEGAEKPTYEEAHKAVPEEGKYQLIETAAPAGYTKNEAIWIVDVQENGSVQIKEGDKELKVKPVESTGTNGTKVSKQTFYFNNTPVYALPSTGGEGIYWYSIGGMLMMCAAVLILYRNKNKKVRGCRRA